jgi:formyl-CoA transferase/CoA:oxalate CoA-transferase
LKGVTIMKPLEGIRVIACEHFIAGPMCTMMLGDMGADVIRVEPPEGETSRSLGPPFVDGEAAYYLSFNRSKRSIILDLRTPEGVNILKKLIKGADVVVENYRVGVMARLGLSYKEVSASNPRIIYCSILAHGQDNPLKDKAGLDAIIQGEWGFMDITGFPDGPPVRAGFAISDNLAGVYAVQGILLALILGGKREEVNILISPWLTPLSHSSPIRRGITSPLNSPRNELAIAMPWSLPTKDLRPKMGI